jgi:predicted nucleic acid-binding protein
MGERGTREVATATRVEGLIDTDVLVDASRGVAEAIRFLDEQRAAASAPISVVSAMELIGGCRNSGDLRAVQQVLGHHTLVPVTARASTVALELMESFFLSHGPLIPDALIAATARENGLVLFTRNVRHYQMIGGLQARRPY